MGLLLVLALHHPPLVVAALPEPCPFCLQFDEPHGFTTAEARERIQLMFKYWSERFGVTSAWEGNRGNFSGRMFGLHFEGWMVVDGQRVSGMTSDPGFLLRGPARDYIDRKLKKYLHPQYQEPP